MKTREETVDFIQRRDLHTEIKKRNKENKHHYGKQDLRELMDFIYEGEPLGDSEFITVDWLE